MEGFHWNHVPRAMINASLAAAVSIGIRHSQLACCMHTWYACSMHIRRETETLHGDAAARICFEETDGCLFLGFTVLKLSILQGNGTDCIISRDAKKNEIVWVLVFP